MHCIGRVIEHAENLNNVEFCIATSLTQPSLTPLFHKEDNSLNPFVHQRRVLWVT